MNIFKLIIESYLDIWEDSKLAFVLSILPIVLSIASIVITILK